MIVGDAADRAATPTGNVASRARPARNSRVLQLVALLGLSAAITLTTQVWVGGATIYSPELKDHRERLHQIILENRAQSPGEKRALGVNTTNIRIGTVYAAEAIHRATGLSISRVYRVMDTVALFAALPLVFWLFRRMASREYALLAMLYVGSILPLTYFLFYFHPWDRPTLVLWILMLACIHDDRPVLLGALLLVSMVVKFDALFLPGLYFLVHANRGALVPVARKTAGLFVVTVGTYAVLRMIFPGGSAVGNAWWQIRTNFQHMADYSVGYPPLLGLGVPVFLALIGWRHANRFARACVVFAGGLAGIYFLNSNFAELRAMMNVVLLVLPAALVGARDLLSAPSVTPAPANRA
ncbi:MAG: hypothetical protein K0S86_895 [Geminicoccaceae bacterium]|nr:hypothetical protein [Geminicoccaceae bacterium]